MTYKRRCDNWLLTYRDYILPRTDAPESFVFWSGIYTISSALRRRVWIPKDILGVWSCYPHMYLMFVGPPGVRKTTTIDNGARPLLKQVEGLKEGPDFFTKEVVLERMQQSTDSAIFMSIDEFSSVFQKAGKDRAGVYEFFTAMYDSKVQLESATKSHGTAFLENPCINFFSATTPGWIVDYMPESVINGGFASRCIWVYEDKPRINKMFFDDVTGPFLDMEADLLLDLIHISKNLAGPFKWASKQDRDFCEEWTLKDPPLELQKNDKLGGYLNRRKMHVAKLAMIHSVLEKDELLLTQRDWEFGVNAIEGIEINLPKIFGGVGKNRYTTEIDKIVSYVKNMNFYTNEAVMLDDILRTFMHSAEPRALKDIIDFAVDSKMLRHRAFQDSYQFWVPEFDNIMKEKMGLVST